MRSLAARATSEACAITVEPQNRRAGRPRRRGDRIATFFAAVSLFAAIVLTEGDARDIATRPVEVSYETKLHRIAAAGENDRYRCGDRLGGQRQLVFGVDAVKTRMLARSIGEAY